MIPPVPAVAVFSPGDASVRRWVVQRVESALLAATSLAGATWPMAVRVSSTRCALPGLTPGQEHLPGRRVGVGDALRLGFVVVDVEVGAEKPVSEQAGRYEASSEVQAYARLPLEKLWGERRDIDVAERVGADVYAAVMADIRLGGLVTLVRSAGGMGLFYQDGDDGGAPEPFVMRGFSVQHRSRVESLSWPERVSGDPPDADPIDAFFVRREQSGGVVSARVEIVGGAVRLYTNSGPSELDATVSTVGKTVAQVRAEIDAVELWGTTDTSHDPGVQTTLDAQLAEDLFVNGDGDALTTPEGMALR